MPQPRRIAFGITELDPGGAERMLTELVTRLDRSEWEPHVTFVPGADPSTLHVIINGLHPYYQTLEAKDSMHECVQQYIFDAVAEFKTSKLLSRVNPDSVRRLKNDLLRARAEQLDNADAEVRAQAEADLFGKNTDSAAGQK